MDTKMNRVVGLLKKSFGFCCVVMVVGLISFHSGYAQPDQFHRLYRWEFQGEQFSLDYAFSWSNYHFYQQKQRVFYNYAVYSYENPRYATVPDFVERLKCLAEDKGFDREETMRFVISFVQQLEYQPDRGEYPKFPVETLSERGGDCEDTSILLVAMLRELGYNSIMINPPGHMAIAIACNDCRGTAYNSDGQRFYYVETTSKGFDIGQVPEEYRTTTDKILHTKARPEELWVLRSFVPHKSASGMVYLVSEDAGTQMAKSQRGVTLQATTTLKTVEVDGKFSTSKSIQLRLDPRDLKSGR